MFSLPNIEMPSILPLLFIFLAVLVWTLLKEVLAITIKHQPQQPHDKISSTRESIIGNDISHMTLIIDEMTMGGSNEMFKASENYMRKQISPSVERLKVSKTQKEKDLCFTIDQGVEVVDTFEGIQFTWKLFEMKRSQFLWPKLFELNFHKKHWKMVQESYLPHVLRESKAMKEENKAIKLNSLERERINLHHPSTFETLAMDPTLKEELKADLDRFVKRKDFYRRVGKVWKRGYLLYGPPGTGKSSLIAAIANHLKFHIYDVELEQVRNNPGQLKRLLLTAEKKSILVIEDIDSSSNKFGDRRARRYVDRTCKLTLSGLLNFIDGLWSSCGDERIIIFTTNHKERLDPAILRPGRMDMHIHMSYCTFDGFKILATNYLGIKDYSSTERHSSIAEIEELLIPELKVTPAEIAEELMKADEADKALEGLLKFLHTKKTEHDKANSEGESDSSEQPTIPSSNEEGIEEERKH